MPGVGYRAIAQRNDPEVTNVAIVSSRLASSPDVRGKA